MNKEWRNMLIFMGVFIILVWFIVSPVSDNETKEEGLDYENPEDNFSNVQQIHWGSMPLKYKITNPEKCDLPLKNLELSFEIIENSTDGIVSFQEVEGESDIEVVCVNRDDFDRMFEDFDNCKKELKECANHSYDYERFSFNAYEEGVLDKTKEVAVSVRNIFSSSTKTTYEVCSVSLETSDQCYDSNVENQEVFERLFGDELTIGEAEPLAQGNILVDGTIYLYDNDDRWKSCIHFPVREMHELLHLFGFEHVQEVERYGYYGELNLETQEALERYHDIMYPEYRCANWNKLNEEYVSCLKYIYSNGSSGEPCESQVKFLEFDETGHLKPKCEEGWHPVEGSEYCCPEPNMYIDSEGFCASL